MIIGLIAGIVLGSFLTIRIFHELIQRGKINGVLKFIEINDKYIKDVKESETKNG